MSRAFATTVATATAAAALLRLWHLDHHGLWLDELFTARAVGRETWGGLLEEVAADVHPPLYYALLRVWTGLVGLSEITLRLPTALAGVAAVPLTALLGRRVMSPGAGVVGGWLLALSPYAVALDREARSNGVLAFLGVAGLWLMARSLDRDRGWSRHHLLGGVLAALLAWTHVFGIFAVGAQALWVGTLAGAAPAARRRWLLALSGGLATLAPWLGVLVGQAQRFAADPWYQIPPWDALPWLWLSLSGDQPGVAAILGVGLLLALLREPRGLEVVLAGLIALVVVPLVLSLAATPVLRARNVAPLVPLLCLAAGAGWASLRPPALAAAATGVVTTFVALAAWGRVQDPPFAEAWREAAGVVRHAWRDGDTLRAHHPQLWRFYLPDSISPEPLDAPLPRLAGTLWVLVAHDKGDADLAGFRALGTVVDEQHFTGAAVLAVLPDAETVPLERFGPRQPDQLVDGVLHLWWTGQVTSTPLSLSGTCRVEVVGWGDEADNEPAQLTVGVLHDEQVVAEQSLALLPGGLAGGVAPFVVPEPGSYRVALRFDNDGTGVGRDGQPADRNAHLTAVRVVCVD